MIIDYTGTSPLGTWTGSAYSGIDGYIQTGYNGGAWNGNGIFSSSASGMYTMLAAAEASDVLGISGASTGTFSGKTVDATSVLIKFSYGGDADLSGSIDGNDYARIDANVGSSGSVFGYAAGDFNYDGRIDADDYFIIDSNYGTQGSPL